MSLDFIYAEVKGIARVAQARAKRILPKIIVAREISDTVPFWYGYNWRDYNGLNIRGDEDEARSFERGEYRISCFPLFGDSPKMDDDLSHYTYPLPFQIAHQGEIVFDARVITMPRSGIEPKSKGAIGITVYTPGEWEVVLNEVYVQSIKKRMLLGRKSGLKEDCRVLVL